MTVSRRLLRNGLLAQFSPPVLFQSHAESHFLARKAFLLVHLLQGSFFLLFSVIFRPHALRVTFEHVQPAYLEEHFPIDVVLTNLDTQELEFEVDILMQPTADESGLCPVALVGRLLLS